MSDTAWGVVFASALIVAAGLVAMRTWQVTHTTVRWMRPTGSRVAHAVTKVELASELAEVWVLGHCGRWPVTELVRDDRAERCAACVREVERTHHR